MELLVESASVSVDVNCCEEIVTVSGLEIGVEPERQKDREWEAKKKQKRRREFGGGGIRTEAKMRA